MPASYVYVFLVSNFPRLDTQEEEDEGQGGEYEEEEEEDEEEDGEGEEEGTGVVSSRCNPGYMRAEGCLIFPQTVQATSLTAMLLAGGVRPPFLPLIPTY